MTLRSLIYFMEQIEDERSIKQFSLFVPKILPALFSTFTNDTDVDAKGREKVLQLFYLCLRTVSWADGLDNQLVEDCLNETFNNWMALFVQLIQTNPKSFFDIKRNALKCLTVIFRDFLNYSRECINMILRPTWKLFNFHLPIYTEVIGYGSKGTGGDSEDIEQAEKKGYESDDDEESTGVLGMTSQLIELLTTLVSRPNVQEIVKQGLLPLISVASSYMIIPANEEQKFRSDLTYFVSEKNDDLLRMRSITNTCIDMISSIVEAFGDTALEAILVVVENFL